MHAPDPVQDYSRRYGARTKDIVGMAKSAADLGLHFGGHLYKAEAHYLVAKEWTQQAAHVLTRRTKHYLHLTFPDQAAFTAWFAATI